MKWTVSMIALLLMVMVFPLLGQRPVSREETLGRDLAVAQLRIKELERKLQEKEPNWATALKIAVPAGLGLSVGHILTDRDQPCKSFTSNYYEHPSSKEK